MTELKAGEEVKIFSPATLYEIAHELDMTILLLELCHGEMTDRMEAEILLKLQRAINLLRTSSGRLNK